MPWCYSKNINIVKDNGDSFDVEYSFKCGSKNGCESTNYKGRFHTTDEGSQSKPNLEYEVKIADKLTGNESKCVFTYRAIHKFNLTYDDNGGSGCSNKPPITKEKGLTWGTLCKPYPADSSKQFYDWRDKANTNLEVKSTTVVEKNTVAQARYISKELNFNGQTLNSGIYPNAYTSNSFTGASGGIGPYEYTIVSGGPTGAKVDSDSRKISFPEDTNTGTYSVKVRATDTTTGKYKDVTMSITIKCNTVVTGKLSAGETVTYAGTRWTVVSSSGGNVNLAYNGTSGSGKYDDAITSVDSFLKENKILKNALANSCITNNGSSSGTSTGYTSAKYWTDATHFYNNETLKPFEIVSHPYSSGYRVAEGVQAVRTHPVKDLVKESTTEYGTGIKAISSPFSVDSNGVLSFKDGAYNTKTYGNGERGHSRVFTDIILKAPSNSTAIGFKYRYCEYDSSTDSDTYGYNIKSYIDSTGKTVRFNIYVCGGDSNADNAQGKELVFRAKSTSQFYYGNEHVYYRNQKLPASERVPCGWTNKGFEFDTALVYDYNKNYYVRTAGHEAIDCSKNVNCSTHQISGHDRYVRNVYAATADNCKKSINSYELKSKDLGKISYRPYITVKNYTS